ncbi:hypothetical protein LSUE1_G002077 [Lachnellula suecica]|uniref:DUF7726 domain-containing protein n=1 Tax=Lachnellula suecica TaxID=602035 RepID=A0A8T9CH38_9HELO|nr:hypothetical protein LSUE1_G002077 [Lachnellula suecica]
MSYDFIPHGGYRRPLGPANRNIVINPVPAYALVKPTIASAPMPAGMPATIFAPMHVHALPAPAPAPAAPPAKRKALELELDDDEGDGYYIFLQNCDQVRRKLRALLGAGEMKLGELQKTLGVSAKSFSCFMGKNGPDNGTNTATFPAAYRFFKQREAEGIKVPKKKVKKDEELRKNDVTSVELDGESDVSVPVYDSCDEIRKKISAYLREPQITQAGFLREAAKTYPDGRKIQSKVLNDFLSKKGASAGNTSAVFYSSYVFFEKMRLRDGKPKSKHRQEMESRHPSGFDTKRRREHVWCREGENPYQDAYGDYHIAGRF